MKKLILPMIYISAASSGLTPLDVSGCVLWLDADLSDKTYSSENYVSQIDDLSGNNNHATQSNTSRQPNFLSNIDGSRGVLQFDGASDYLNSLQNQSTTANYTFIFRVKYLNNVNTQFTMGMRSTTGNTRAYPLVVGTNTDFQCGWGDTVITSSFSFDTNINVFSFVKNTSSFEIFKNGISGGSSSFLANISSDLDFVIGCLNSQNIKQQFANIQLTSMAIYNRALTAQERQQVESII